MRLDDGRIIHQIFRHVRIGKSAGEIADCFLSPPVADGGKVTRKFEYQALLDGWFEPAGLGLQAFVEVAEGISPTAAREEGIRL